MQLRPRNSLISLMKSCAVKQNSIKKGRGSVLVLVLMALPHPGYRF